jgi:acetyl/propionyl-CoA carboxylase alpha subunit
MNTRLQVEHPFTEMITGLDLVKEQIKIARGEKLSFSQKDLKINGHAIEARVYAEDPLNNFLPDIGRLQTYRIPQGPGVRVDDGFEEGMDIPIYYDPMLAKLIAYGKDRGEVIARMIRAIEEYEISGVSTTLPFCKFVMQHERFVSGNFDTHFVDKYFKPEMLVEENDEEMEIAAMVAATLVASGKKRNVLTSEQNATTLKWKRNRTELRE